MGKNSGPHYGANTGERLCSHSYTNIKTGYTAFPRQASFYVFDKENESLVKRRGTLAKPWRWEIFLAGKSVPVKRSTVFFESMSEAMREALADFLGKRAA